MGSLNLKVHYYRIHRIVKRLNPISVVSRNIELEEGASSSSILGEFNTSSYAISMGAQWEESVQY